MSAGVIGGVCVALFDEFVELFAATSLRGATRDVQLYGPSGGHPTRGWS